MGETGCVAWMFERKGLIILNLAGTNKEEVEMAIIESGADDMKIEEDIMEVYTNYLDFPQVKKALENAGLKIERAEVVFIAKNQLKIEDESTARKIIRLMEALEEDEDVTSVASNFDIDEELLKRLGD
ncbi:MAG: hypothetical protein UT55_C0020G0009 [Candidatus Peregrinibacteria bacterium GW2011_GWE2_39_6]|nr:MAG: hypothetical protein UT55_C0020G0009 [Candidatus Peregrinibacteria bacterium GW2011_GWE2_39_6]